MQHRAIPILVVVGFALWTAACGGGGGGSAAGPIPPPPIGSPSPTATPTQPPFSGSAGYLSQVSPTLVQGSIVGTSTSATIVGISEADERNAQGMALPQDGLTVQVGSTAGTYIGTRRVVLTGNRIIASQESELLSDLPPEGPVEYQRYLSQLRPMLLGARGLQSSARTLSLPTAPGSTADLWVNTFNIGGGGGTYQQVSSTLALVTPHSYLWIDNTVLATLASSTVTGIGSDMENAYASDTLHFASPDYPSTAPGLQPRFGTCDSSGAPLGTSSQLYINENDPHIVLFLVGQNSVGQGVGGYFSSLNYIPQPVANCFGGQPKSNEAPMIVVVWPNNADPNFELQEDVVRSTAHELQHLINFVNHAILAQNGGFEETWINEGLSMLSQDFAVRALFPNVPLDVRDAMVRGSRYLVSPQSYSLTSFTGLSSAGVLTYNCSTCYGLEWLFQRYLYDRFGQDAYAQGMERSGVIGFANLQSVTGQNYKSLMGDFAIALASSNTGLTSDPRFNFQNLNLRTTYTNQFGGTLTLNGPTPAATQVPGSSVSYVEYLNAFFYVQTSNLTSAGSGVQIIDNGGAFVLQGGLVQHT